jgi:hypothetical protein
MRATTQGTFAGFLLAFLIFTAGLLVTYFVPGVGCAAGPLFCLVAVAVSFKRRKVWLCDGCGGSFERA